MLCELERYLQRELSTWELRAVLHTLVRGLVLSSDLPYKSMHEDSILPSHMNRKYEYLVSSYLMNKIVKI